MERRHRGLARRDLGRVVFAARQQRPPHVGRHAEHRPHRAIELARAPWRRRRLGAEGTRAGLVDGRIVGHEGAGVVHHRRAEPRAGGPADHHRRGDQEEPAEPPRPEAPQVLAHRDAAVRPGHEHRARERQRVDHRAQIAPEPIARRVSLGPRRSARLAVAAQIERDEPKITRQRPLEQGPPDVPALRDAMHEHQRPPLRIARLFDRERRPVGRDHPVQRRRAHAPLSLARAGFIFVDKITRPPKGGARGPASAPRPRGPGGIRAPDRWCARCARSAERRPARRRARARP